MPLISFAVSNFPVITGGRPRFVGRSRNTPATTRTVRVASCKLPQDFSGVPH